LWSERVYTEDMERRELLPILPISIRPQTATTAAPRAPAVR